MLWILNRITLVVPGAQFEDKVRGIFPFSIPDIDLCDAMFSILCVVVLCLGVGADSCSPVFAENQSPQHHCFSLTVVYVGSCIATVLLNIVIAVWIAIHRDTAFSFSALGEGLEKCICGEWGREMLKCRICPVGYKNATFSLIILLVCMLGILHSTRITCVQAVWNTFSSWEKKCSFWNWTENVERCSRVFCSNAVSLSGSVFGLSSTWPRTRYCMLGSMPEIWFVYDQSVWGDFLHIDSLWDEAGLCSRLIN